MINYCACLPSNLLLQRRDLCEIFPLTQTLHHSHRKCPPNILTDVFYISSSYQHVPHHWCLLIWFCKNKKSKLNPFVLKQLQAFSKPLTFLKINYTPHQYLWRNKNVVIFFCVLSIVMHGDHSIQVTKLHYAPKCNLRGFSLSLVCGLVSVGLKNAGNML